jgi:RNA polymerase sigma-70 factor (ECF subfamily)
MSWSALIEKRALHRALMDLSDADLVRAFQRDGKHPYFMALYERYADKVYYRCLSYSQDPADAEDLSQDVFMKVYGGLRGFRFESDFPTWLHRVTTNHCLNYLRGRKVFEELDEASVAGSAADISRLGTRLDISRSLAVLPRGTRALLILKYVEGYTYAEIARLSGLKVSAVKMRILRAKETLGRTRNGDERAGTRD